MLHQTASSHSASFSNFISSAWMDSIIHKLRAGPDTERAGCLSPPHCSAEPRADTDQLIGGNGSASMVLQDLECIWVQAHARQKTQVLVVYTGHASEPEASAT